MALSIDSGSPVPIYLQITGYIRGAVAAGVYRPGGPGRCGNTITLTGIDGATYTYCHLSLVSVQAGDTVVSGQPLGLSGGQPGTPGAGNTTGPHLHLSVRAYGQSVCPQPLLLAIIRETPIPPAAAPAVGCINPGTTTDWSIWLDRALQNSPTGKETQP